MASPRLLSMSTGYNERTWLTWLVKLRIIILTLMLGIGLAIIRLTPTQAPERLFIAVMLLWYTLAVFFVVLHSIWDEPRLQARVQVLTDLVLSTALIYVTGGIDTSFNFLYPLVIIVAAILLPRWWAYMTAALSFIAFGAILELTFYGVLNGFGSSKPDLRSLQVVVGINLLAYLSIAYLSSYLTAKLRQTGVELEGKRGELQNLQIMQEHILHSMRGGLITTDLDGEITLVNQPAEHYLGKKAREILGQRINSLFLDPLPEVGYAAAQGETRAATAGGEKIFGITASPLSMADGDVVGFVYTFADLTDVRRLEEEVRRRDRMAAVGRLSAGIAHEIRNPLASIAGSAQMLSKAPALNEEQRMLLDIVTRESERLNGIISDFLQYSREKSYVFVATDLLPLIEETLVMLEKQPLASSVRVVRRFEVEQAVATVDAERMRQVFWNLGQNALKAMPNGGTLEVSVRAEGKSWRITFKDTGVGIPAGKLDKIFEPFQSYFEGGTGLGLALVYQIVQAHGASIRVKSQAGAGAQFELTLSQAAAGAPRAKAPAVMEVARG